MLMSELRSERRADPTTPGRIRSVHMSSTAKLHGIKRQLKRQGTSSDLGSSPPPKRLRKKDRELLLHSEMMNDFSDNENENGAATDGDDVMSAFTRR